MEEHQLAVDNATQQTLDAALNAIEIKIAEETEPDLLEKLREKKSKMQSGADWRAKVAKDHLDRHHIINGRLQKPESQVVLPAADNRSENSKLYAQDLLALFTDFRDTLESQGVQSPRNNWMNNCRAADHYQLQVTAILSQNTSDVTLFRAVMTMRKLGLMDKRWLGSGEDDTLRKLENVRSAL